MDMVFGRWLRGDDSAEAESEPATGAQAGFGGDDEPVLVAMIDGPVQIEMAKDALETAGIPAYVKQNSLGPIYGLSVGSFGTAEVWVVRPLAEQARETLVGIGVLRDPGEEGMDQAEEQIDEQ